MNCYICNIYIEKTGIVIDKTKVDTLSEIFGKTLQETQVESRILCKTCHFHCIEYDSMKTKLQNLKTDLTDKFKRTLKSLGMDFNKYPQTGPVKEMKRIVVKASKLQPVPPDLVLNIGNVASAQKNLAKSVIPLTSLSPQKIVKTSSNIKGVNKYKSETIETTLNNTLAAILNSKSKQVKMETLPNNFIVSKVDDENRMKEEMNGNEEINLEEHGMEIDEDCTLIHVTADEVNMSEENNEADTSKKYFDNLLPRDGDDEDNDDDTETIVMTGDNGSILRIMSGQKLVYENGEITLASDDDNSNQDGNNDGHESNEESQIELQVSGDEETANAIIAAAQEQGGAFIKVESGEMFRVKSVHSKTKTDIADKVVQIVEHVEGGFKCLLCKKTGDAGSDIHYDAELMMHHLKEAHNARIYICRICDKIMRKRADFYAHTNEEHGMKMGKLVIDAERGKMHECNICKKKYNSRTFLQEHMNMHNGMRPYSCPVCGKTFASKYTHQAHLKTHMDRKRPFKCKDCTKSFFTLQNLKQHEKTHLGIKDFVCKICGKAFGTQHNLEVHGVVHSGARPFCCDTCGKSFARRAELRDHTRVHTGERPFWCAECGARFSQRSNLHSHRRATHMDDRRYHCTHSPCTKKFKRRRLLEYHIKATHTGERPLQCAVCHATFVYPEHYKKHVRIHSGEKPYMCEVCGKSFNSRDNRNTHRFVHSDKKPYECLVCGAGYMRKQLLYAHMNTTGHLAESIVVNQPRVQKVVKETIVIDYSNPMTPQVGEANIENDDAPKLILAGDKNILQEAVTENDEAPEIILTEDKKFILQDGQANDIDEGKSTINLVQDTDDPTLLTFMQNLDGSKADALQGISAEHLGEQVQMVTTDENGEIRIVQLHIGANPATWALQE